METRYLGPDVAVSAMGLGCVGMSAEYGSSEERDEASSLRTLARAFDLGINLYDTADSYGPFSNEILIGKFIAGKRDEIVISTKVGLVLDPTTGRFVVDAHPDRIRKACEASIRRLGIDQIDLYFLHRVDDRIPLQDSWGELADLQAEGKVRALGMCEVTVDQLTTAHAIAPVSAVQSELSLWTREPLASVVPWCQAHSVGFVPFSPLGRGFLTGAIAAADFDKDDIRSGNPRFTTEAISANREIVEGIGRVAESHGVTTAQVALAWLLAQGDSIVPIPGTKRIAYLEENVGALDVNLTTEDLVTLDSLPMPVGARY